MQSIICLCCSPPRGPLLILARSVPVFSAPGLLAFTAVFWSPRGAAILHLWNWNLQALSPWINQQEVCGSQQSFLLPAPEGPESPNSISQLRFPGWPPIPKLRLTPRAGSHTACHVVRLTLSVVAYQWATMQVTLSITRSHQAVLCSWWINNPLVAWPFFSALIAGKKNQFGFPEVCSFCSQACSVLNCTVQPSPIFYPSKIFPMKSEWNTRCMRTD